MVVTLGLAVSACSPGRGTAPVPTASQTITAPSAPTPSLAVTASASIPEAPPEAVVAAPTVEGPPIDRAIWSPSGKLLGLLSTRPDTAPAKASPSMVLHILDLARGILLPSVPVTEKEAGPSCSVVFSPDSAYVGTSLTNQG